MNGMENILVVAAEVVLLCVIIFAIILTLIDVAAFFTAAKTNSCAICGRFFDDSLMPWHIVFKLCPGRWLSGVCHPCAVKHSVKGLVVVDNKEDLDA